MFLKSITIENFRKFGKENESRSNNTVEFIDASDYNKDFLESKKINIAPKTTLIIGKNNSGKTTIIQALTKLLNSNSFFSTDFNYCYLAVLLKQYSEAKSLDEETIVTPEMTFRLVVGIDSHDNNSDDQDEDILTNIIPFMNLSNVEKSEVTIYIKWEVQEKQIFLRDLKNFIKKNYKEEVLFDKFLELINNSKYKVTYYNEKNKVIDYSIKNLIEITPVNAIKVTNDKCLSESFSKIVEYRYKNCKESQENNQQDIASKLDSEILSINEELTGYVNKHHTTTFNNSLKKMLKSEKCQVLLKSDLTFKKLINGVIQYNYLEGKTSIPENQFGLGYTNLMMIIAEIISYMEKYPDSSFNSKINLISIEEPETYMHPQMQENFIKNINEMITSLLEDKNKHVNSQIIITTHSAHIVNSKIHQGNTFNNINYIVDEAGASTVVCLKDEDVVALTKKQLRKVDKIKKDEKSVTDNSKNETETDISKEILTEEISLNDEDVEKNTFSEEGAQRVETYSKDDVNIQRPLKNIELTEEEILTRNNNLAFIKKHIKFKVSELFFADYVIFVEGITEYTLLQYYIDKHDDSVLNKCYGSVILIDGSHAKLYENLIALLKIPTLIITDLDIERKENEKSEKDKCTYLQLDDKSIADRITKNDSLKHFYSIIEKDSLRIETICNNGYIIKNNLMISTQLKPIQGYFATSFEEAFILTNFENDMLKQVLKKLKPDIYENIIKEGLIKNSYKFQMKLANSKSEFANELLYSMIVNESIPKNIRPVLPQYIIDGLEFLCKKLEDIVNE